MYKRLNEELRRLQQQLKDLQASPTHVTITHHHEAASPPKSEPKEKVCMCPQCYSEGDTPIT